MARTRDWRRYKSECHFLKRIKRKSYFRYVYMFWRTYSVRQYDSTWIDAIGTDYVNKYKDVRTTKWDSKRKLKYGKKGKRNFDWSSNANTRPKDKVKFFKELIDYGY